MTKVLKYAVLLAVLLVSVDQYAKGGKQSINENDTIKTHASYWSDVMNAIIQVESGGNSKAVNGQYVGAMQIAPVLVKECNNILQRRGFNKRYTLADRYSINKSKEMFLLIQSHYNPTNNIEKGIRIWNGGCNYRVKSTNGYYRKVMRKMQNA